MELDFSKIDNLGSSQKPASEPKEVNHSKPLKTAKKPAEGKKEPQAQALQRKANDRKKQLEDSAGILKEYQKNKRLTNEIVAEITKGIQQGADIHGLFLKAVEALALTANDTLLYDNARQNLKTIYGIGLKETYTLELEREDTQTRLERLTQALNDAVRVEDKERLKNAIEAHQKHLKAIQA